MNSTQLEHAAVLPGRSQALAHYCARLVTYSRRAPVGRDEAIARAIDLRCCSPKLPTHIRENDAYFNLCMDEYRGEWLVVDRIQGQMRLQHALEN